MKINRTSCSIEFIDFSKNQDQFFEAIVALTWMQRRAARQTTKTFMVREVGIKIKANRVEVEALKSARSNVLCVDYIQGGPPVSQSPLPLPSHPLHQAFFLIKPEPNSMQRCQCQTLGQKCHEKNIYFPFAFKRAIRVKTKHLDLFLSFIVFFLSFRLLFPKIRKLELGLYAYAYFKLIDISNIFILSLIFLNYCIF